VEELKGMIFSPESIAGQLAGVDTEIAERTALLESLTHENGKLAAEADKPYRLYLDGNITGKEFGERRPIRVPGTSPLRRLARQFRGVRRGSQPDGTAVGCRYELAMRILHLSGYQGLPAYEAEGRVRVYLSSTWRARGHGSLSCASFTATH
jgi:hypothetical protein